MYNILCIFLGWLGLHKFYEKKVLLGIIYFFTGGLFGIAWLYDILKLLITNNIPRKLIYLYLGVTSIFYLKFSPHLFFITLIIYVGFIVRNYINNKELKLFLIELPEYTKKTIDVNKNNCDSTLTNIENSTSYNSTCSIDVEEIDKGIVNKISFKQKYSKLMSTLNNWVESDEIEKKTDKEVVNKISFKQKYSKLMSTLNNWVESDEIEKNGYEKYKYKTPGMHAYDNTDLSRANLTRKLTLNNLSKKEIKTYLDDFIRYKDPIFVLSGIEQVKNIWNFWTLEQHHSKDQYWRRRNSFSTDHVDIDFNTLSGVFIGSNNELYFTTLKECSCMDFKKRYLPCKHIYRLFYEFENGTVKDFDNSIIQEHHLNKLKDLNKEYIDKYIELAKNPEYTSAEIDAPTKTLIEEGLVTVSELNYNNRLHNITKNDIIEILQNNNVEKIKKSLRKQELIDWTIENHSDILDLHYKYHKQIEISKEVL